MVSPNGEEVVFGLVTLPKSPTSQSAACGRGILSNRSRAIDLAGGTEEFFVPTELNGPGKGSSDGSVAVGTRLWLQPTGNNTLTYVQQGEQVANTLLVSGINATLHPRLALKYRYQPSYQKVTKVVAKDGTVATFLGKGSSLPPLASISGFSYFDKNGELYIFDVPGDGAGD
jgi:hypothetical protein